MKTKRSIVDQPKGNLINLEAEGDFRLKWIQTLHLNNLKLFLHIFLSIIFVPWGFILFWNNSLRKNYLYDLTNELDKCTHCYVMNKDKSLKIIKLQKQDGLIWFEVMLLKYVYSGESHFNLGVFKPLEYVTSGQLTNAQLFQKQNEQFSTQNHKNLYGKNEIKIPQKSFGAYFFYEWTKPLMFFQYIGFVVWYFEDETLFGIIMISASFVITAINYILNLVQIKNLNKLSGDSFSVQVYSQDGSSVKIEQVDCNNLFPGDVIEVEPKMKIPADSVILQGRVNMDEGMLTGESVPIQKQALISNDTIFSYDSCQKSILFQGTKVLQKQESTVKAMILRTGFSTQKGQLIRSMVFQKKETDYFLQQAVIFLFFFGVFAFIIYIPVFMHMKNSNYYFDKILLRVLDIVLWTIPPTLPIFFNLVLLLSSIRLKSQEILNNNPDKLVQAGMVNTCCFDKTGTLTIQGMEFNNLIVNKKGDQFGNNYDFHQSNQDDIELQIMGNCHNIVEIDGNVIGDMVDIAMQKQSKFDLSDSTFDKLKIFDFDSNLQRMSVLVQNNKTSEHFIFVKGSPEIIQKLSNHDSLPKNYTKIQDEQSIQGYRMIAIGFKKITNVNLSREELENDITFAGFLTFVNPLKPDSAQIIHQLNEGNIECKLITGDNIFTGIEAGFQTNIMDRKLNSCLLDFQNHMIQIQLFKNSEVYYEQKFEVQEQDELKKGIMRNSIKITNGVFVDLKEVIDKYQESQGEFQLAMTGPFFKLINQHNAFIAHSYSNEILIQDLIDDNKFTEYLIYKCKVFGRMKAVQKSQVVEKLQKMGLKVCMTGDGVNDCQAIKQADIGISFCESEASLSSPFSSMDLSIQCVTKVILEGRVININFQASLQSKNEVFANLMLNSIQSIFLYFICTIYDVYYPSLNNILLNLGGRVIYSVFWGVTPPVSKLQHQPPTSQILSFSYMVPMVFITVMMAICDIISVEIIVLNVNDIQTGLINQEYRKTGIIPTMMFLLAYFWISALLLICSFDTYYKKPLYHNFICFPVFCILVVWTSCMFFGISDIEYSYLNVIVSLSLKIYLLQIGIVIFIILVNQLAIKKYFFQKNTNEIQIFKAKQNTKKYSVQIHQTNVQIYQNMNINEILINKEVQLIDLKKKSENL